MGKKRSAKTGGASIVMKRQLEKKSAKAARPVESDEESEESGNYMTFDKKKKGDSEDEEEDRDIFNLALDKDDDDEVGIILCTCSHEHQGNDNNLIMNHVMIFITSILTI